MLKANILKKKEKRASGIKCLQDGSSIIPSSVRPDGSIRSERKVRPGYVPPEDISVYRVAHHDEYSKKINCIPPGTQGYLPPGAMVHSNLSKSAKRRAKQKKKSQIVNNKDEIQFFGSQVKDDFSLVDDIEKRVQSLNIQETRT